MAEPSKKNTGRESPPPGYPSAKEKYADPANYKYPIDTREHVRAAWDYIHQQRNQAGYSSSELAYIKDKIRAAGKRFGMNLSA